MTWTGTVARVLDANCGMCHGEGGVSGPRLDDYEAARGAAQAIKRAVLTRHMPRWYAASGFGDFTNDPSLTPHAIEQLAQWVDGGALYGDAAPPARARAAAAAKPPDLVLAVPATSRITEAQHTFHLPTGLRDVRAVRGWTFQPGHPSVVASAVISLASGKRLGTWVPGERDVFLPDGVTARLPVGAELLLTVFYRMHEVPPDDASRVGLYFADRPGRELAVLSVPCGVTRLRQSIDALAIRPILGSSAWSMAVLARRPAGSIEPLGWFQNYPRDHAQTYWFRRSVRLPRGTAVDVGAMHGMLRSRIRLRAVGGTVARRRVTGSRARE